MKLSVADLFLSALLLLVVVVVPRDGSRVVAFSAVGRDVKPSTSTTTSQLFSTNDRPMGAYEAQMRAMSNGQGMPNGNTATMDPQPLMGVASSKVEQRWRKKTKQLATLGPASSSLEMIERLFLAGADVFRLNFSHGEHDQKRKLVELIRQVEAKYDHPIAILGDLQGPKLRVGTFANPDGEYLEKGRRFVFDLNVDQPGDSTRVALPHPEIIEASEVGHVLLIDDGKVRVRVVGTGPGYLECEVEVPGKIKDKKVRPLLLLLLLLVVEFLSSLPSSCSPHHTATHHPPHSTISLETHTGRQHS